MDNRNAILYGGLMVANAVLCQLAIELGAGRVPLPESWQWVVPILSAGLVALTSLLPRIGAERTVEKLTVKREITEDDPRD